MPSIREMVATHPLQGQVDINKLTECVEACFECVQVCGSCADACLAEDMIADLRSCIRTNLDCADICDATGRVLVRQTGPDWSLVEAQLRSCHAACRACRAECENHQGMHEHCKVCVQSCTRCEEACAALLGALPT